MASSLAREHSRQPSLLSTLSDSFSSSYCSHSLSSHSRQASLLSSHRSSPSHSRHSSQLSECTSPPLHLPPSSHHSRESSYDNPAYSPSPRTSHFKLPPSLSPHSADLGYHTMVGPHSSPSLSPAPSLDLSSIPPCPQGVVRPRPPAIPSHVHLEPSLHRASYTSYTSSSSSSSSPLLLLPDSALLHLLRALDTTSLVRVGVTCRRLHHLAWSPHLWAHLRLVGEVAADTAVTCILATLARGGARGAVTSLTASSSALTDQGLEEVARHCPSLTALDMRGCRGVTDTGLTEVIARCNYLTRLNMAGCSSISGLSPGQGVRERLGRGLAIQHLDMSDCPRLREEVVEVVARSSPHLEFLYLRRLPGLTDSTVRTVASSCFQLRELSISDCPGLTDVSLLELARLGPSLRYLSAAKCSRVTDRGVIAIARHCYKLRYLNIRGCSLVTDSALEQLARSAAARLRSLDIGKCDVTDAGLKVLSVHCLHLRKLSVRGCELVGDGGVVAVARACRLHHLNIQDTSLTLDTYRAVRTHCPRCIIEHTNPGFH